MAKKKSYTWVVETRSDVNSAWLVEAMGTEMSIHPMYTYGEVKRHELSGEFNFENEQTVSLSIYLWKS